MEYRTTDPTTGIQLTAEQEPGSECTVTLRVPSYDGTDDEQALRMQARAAVQIVFALDVMDRALSMDRVVRKRFRSVGRNIWRLVTQAPQWLDVRGVVAYPASLC